MKCPACGALIPPPQGQITVACPACQKEYTFEELQPDLSRGPERAFGGELPVARRDLERRRRIMRAFIVVIAVGILIGAGLFYYFKYA